MYKSSFFLLLYLPVESASPLFIFVITMQLPSKRVMDGPSFDVHRAESSHQHVMAGPASLDPRRAEAASKHVRALNTQFARCVPSPVGLYSSCVLKHILCWKHSLLTRYAHSFLAFLK
jgi:hypothetical protein